MNQDYYNKSLMNHLLNLRYFLFNVIDLNVVLPDTFQHDNNVVLFFNVVNH